MPFDKSVIDRDFKEFEFVVETGKIREYAKALGLGDPVYTVVEAAKEAGYPNLVAPPTFTRQFWFDDDENDPMRHLGFDLGRRLLGGYSFEYFKPIFAGMKLIAKNSVVSSEVKKGRKGGQMTFVVIKTEFRDENGEIVQIDYRTLIETG